MKKQDELRIGGIGLQKQILINGIKFIYEYRSGNLTSFCIGFEAGALMEEGYKKGIAHVVEHMLFKGTSTRSEKEINKLCDEVFAFHNAMTNYPYCIYYGTTLSEDFRTGFELYSDIILNPSFKEEGFKEEIDIICEELLEWKDDITQYCEDELLFNAFKNRRIKELIIGSKESVKSITLDEIKAFYERFYAPENCVVTVISSLGFHEVLKIVKENLGEWRKEYVKPQLKLYEDNISGIFIKERKGISGAKLQYIYSIHELTDREVNILKLFNVSFGEGISSILYDEVRTKHGLVYDIGSTIKNEKGIKLYTIYFGTSKFNIKTAIKLIDSIINDIKTSKNYFTKERIENTAKIIKLKREFNMERAVELCKSLTSYEIMYGSYEKFLYEENNLNNFTEEEILKVINKVLTKPSIQIISPEI
ncbi:insulinase family protein [Clostridium sp. SYSU_GA19001]|uniref:M16 family metallopeptidase n=1 Tax=Clostridium caldaquaticum TaxID=2940653 RepID=UPI00207785D1|nr:pitrilysin family protein [Clostridium caldaquaticum]MCM8711728.1 insulinase family protein [Clostridium caldaquaticum]